MEQDAFLIEELLDEGQATEDAPAPARRPDRDRPPALADDAGKYDKFMRNEPAWKVSDVFLDERGRRCQYWLVGMTRNAAAENRVRETVLLDPVPHVVKDQDVPLRGWYKGKFEPTGIRARPCYTDALLTQPYGGTCTVGCAFCYINNGVRGYRGAGLTVVDPSYPDKIRRQVRGMRTATAFYMSSFIDPFLELEDVYGNTRRTAQVALDNGLPMFFLTRRRVPGWAYDALKQNRYSYMQFSINTSDPGDWARLSPKAVSLEEQVQQVREMKRRGIYVSIQVNPICAGVTSNEDVVALIHLLASAGADHLIFKFVEIVIPSRAALVRQMYSRFGPGRDPRRPDGRRAAMFEALFTQVIGGVYTIDEEYRKQALNLFARECKKAGVTMALCYEYEYERNPDGSVRNKTGVSMGARYLTADQCHGHRVPVFSRNGPDEPWREIEGCPPSGCLTCAEQFPGAAVPCENPTLAAAPAWTAKDLRRPALTPGGLPTLPVLNGPAAGGGCGGAGGGAS